MLATDQSRPFFVWRCCLQVSGKFSQKIEQCRNQLVCGNRPIQCLAKCAARTIWQQRMSSWMPSVSRLTSGIPERQIVRNERNRNGNKQLVKNNKENNCKGRNQMEYQKRKLGEMGILTRRLWKVGHLKEFNYLF